MKRENVDVLVVGAGPAGLAAAAGAARGGMRVGLVDDNSAPGGQIWRGGRAAARGAAARWIARASAHNVRTLTGAKAVGPAEDRALLVETPWDAIEIGYGQLILATGARELFLPFPGWTLPGVTGAGGLQALVKGGLPIAGRRVVVAGSGPLLLAVAAYLRGRGAHVAAILEQAPWSRLAAFAPLLLRDPRKLGQAARLSMAVRGVPFLPDSWVVRAQGESRLNAITMRHGRRTRTLNCEYLACGYGLVPNSELAAALGCDIHDGAVRVDEWQRTSRAGVYCAGEVTGVGGLELSLLEGRIAGLAAAGRHERAGALVGRQAGARGFAAGLARSFALRDELKDLVEDDTIVCRCEDVPYRDIRGHTSWRGAKLHTRCGMGPCQGRVCGAATAFLRGWTQDSIRPPITPARLGSLTQPDATLAYPST